MSDYSEDSIVEQPAIELFAELGWETANCYYEKLGKKATLGRDTTNEVVLVPRPFKWKILFTVTASSVGYPLIISLNSGQSLHNVPSRFMRYML
ncbi:HsdR family type I site-specificdeoxyribonuclease [groundwater metagenome]